MAMTGNMLDCFWKRYGDIERDSSFSAEECKAKFPHVYMAWENYKAAEKLMDAAVASVRYEE